MKRGLTRLRRLVRQRLLLPPAQPRTVIALDPRMHDLVAADATIERVCTRMKFTEGPVWSADRAALVFSDIPANRMLEWRAGHLRVMRQPSEHANGNTLDHCGRLLTCEHSGRRVVRAEFDGTLEVLASHWQGQRLNSPNDIVVRSDGTIYFTDPPFGIPPHEAELGFSGIFRIAPDGELALVSDALQRPNGLALSRDERHLYVDDSAVKQLHRFSVTPSGTLEDRHMVLDMDKGLPGNPDGMKIDRDGNLFIAGPGGVWVVSPAMEQLGLIRLPELPSNCAWGDDGHSLYVTARRSVYRVRCRTAGVILAGSEQ